MEEKIARWLGVDPYLPGSIRFRWHGENGLLKEISNKELMELFLITLGETLGLQTDWGLVELEDVGLFMCATPAQLVAALCKVIDDETKGGRTT